MISLLTPILTTAAPSTSVSLLLPRDCIQYVMQFTHTQTTLSMFLVCRHWYHAVDRIVLLGDTFYYLPEWYVDEVVGRGKILPSMSSSLSSLQDDVRWGHVEVMVLKVLDRDMEGTMQGRVALFPPSLTSLHFRENDSLTDTYMEHVSTLTSLTS
eukprot:PhF_6_TR32942/c4_g1_i3/m.48448